MPAPSAELPTQPDLSRIYWRGPEIQEKDKEQD
jgi:hypothetical protein